MGKWKTELKRSIKLKLVDSRMLSLYVRTLFFGKQGLTNFFLVNVKRK